MIGMVQLVGVADDSWFTVLKLKVTRWRLCERCCDSFFHFHSLFFLSSLILFSLSTFHGVIWCCFMISCVLLFVKRMRMIMLFIVLIIKMVNGVNGIKVLVISFIHNIMKVGLEIKVIV